MPATRANADTSLLKAFRGSPSLATSSSLLKAVLDRAACSSFAGLLQLGGHEGAIVFGRPALDQQA